MHNLEDVKTVYFVGIGGVGMSAAAGLLKQAGFEVKGSDSKEVYEPAKSVIKDLGVEYFQGYNAENIKKTPSDLYIISAGETLTNPEVAFIYENNLPHMGFAEVLYHLAKDRLRIVATGTHGKSTTTGFLGHMLKELDDSSFFTGAILQNYNKNFYSGTGHYFVFEGDEYKAEFDDPTPKFHFYKPDILVLTNLEFDHPDVFENFEVLQDEFRLLISKLPEDGLIVYNADDIALSQLVRETEVSSASFGIDNEADYKVEQIQYSSEFTEFEIFNKFSKNISSTLLGQTEQYKIQLPGKINVYNALATIATLRALGFSQEQIALDLLTYKGVKRRFEIVGTKNGVTLIDDYAHHPTAVKETLNAAKLKYPNSKIWAVFEPHTFSRTQATLKELATSFDSANQVLISEIYPARENIKEATISSEQIINEIRGNALKLKSADSVRLVHNKSEALEILKNELKPTDVVVVMAVGDFNRLAYELKEAL